MSERETKELLKSREWLNDDEGMTGFIATGVSFTTWTYDETDGSYNGKRGAHVDANIEIADCSRKITLDFGLSSNLDYMQAQLNKLDRLCARIHAFRNAYLEATNAVRSHLESKPSDFTDLSAA